MLWGFRLTEHRFQSGRSQAVSSHQSFGMGGVTVVKKTLSQGSSDAPERRVLLCLTGMSPQIVTETLFALAVQSDPPWIPEEIHIITTSEGSKMARKELADPGAGHLWALVRDYGLPEIRFDPDFVHVLRDRTGRSLADIRSGEDNEDAADFIVEVVRTLTEDPSCSLHVSLAGGRKTMGFYAGYALSLFGRPQDCLSHVLVSAPFESLPDFYYPPLEPVRLPSRTGESFDTHDAVVTLASIPFVLLRQLLPKSLLRKKKPFRDAVQAVQKSFPPHRLLLDIKKQAILAGDTTIRLPPSELAVLCWFARRKQRGEPPLFSPKKGIQKVNYAQDYLKELKTIRGILGDIDRTEQALKKGMDQGFFDQKLSRLNAALVEALGSQADPYLIRGLGKRGKSYEIRLRKETIRFGDLPEPSKKEAAYQEKMEPEARESRKNRSLNPPER